MSLTHRHNVCTLEIAVNEFKRTMPIPFLSITNVRPFLVNACLAVFTFIVRRHNTSSFQLFKTSGVKE